MKKRTLAALLALIVLLSACGSSAAPQASAEPQPTGNETAALAAEVLAEEAVPEAEEPAETAPAAAEKTGEIVILYTSDVHCGIDSGFGYAGLRQIRDAMESRGIDTILVDDGDAVQGEAIGTLSKGESIIPLMNAVGYDVAIPGNHEFDYGMEQFLKLTGMADFPYISCNLNREGELVFSPYVIKEAGGKKIAFVGVTTPESLTSSTPASFMDAEGNYIYGFFQDATGETLYNTVQVAVDAARAEGADYVVVLAHLGNYLESAPYNYAELISHTTGIDALLDGHSHDTDQVTMKNMDGQDVIRSACGTKLEHIGYLRISPDGELSAGLYNWNNDVSAAELMGVDNEPARQVKAANDKLAEMLSTVVASTSVDLTINDPEAVDSNGNPIRMVRRAETNLGDLCADAVLDQSGADVAILNGGAVRVNIPHGEITMDDIIRVHPFGNNLAVIEATGQQLLDALEWGARAIPGENGGFLQVAGLTYEIHTYIDSGCKTGDNGLFAGVKGAYRVKNVKVGGEPLNLKKKYVIGSTDYILLQQGDGYSMFKGCTVLQEAGKLDNQVLIDYITETLGGFIGEEYADLTGQDRIVIYEKKP